MQIFAKTEWGLSTQSFSSYLAIFGLVGIFANGFGSVLVKKMGVKKFTTVAILSRMITAVGTAFFGYKGSVIGLLIGLLICGLPFWLRAEDWFRNGRRLRCRGCG